MLRKCDRRNFMRAAGSLLLAGTTAAAITLPKPKPLNFLLIMADDMNCSTPGCFGGAVQGVTPNIDRLAREGMRFEHAHVTIAICQPSRSVLMTGRYPHRNGAEGFQPILDSVPTLNESLAAAGYVQGILGKVGHSTMKQFPWAMVHDQPELGQGRDPEKYYEYAREFIGRAVAQGRPFFLMANSHDPHRPFHGSLQEKNSRGFAENLDKIPKPSQVYKPNEIEVPPFLPDLPKVREEIAQYYSSARRCDDTVGAVMRALRDEGADRDTLVMFLSDNGMALPFAKTNCYLNSTRTPWIVRQPGAVGPAATDRDHFISGIDYMPTVLDAASLPAPAGMDGRSFLPLLRSEKQKGREMVFTQLHQPSNRKRFPMRCVQEKRFGYLFNAWADGALEFKNESQSGLTWAAMREAAKENKDIATRVELYSHRTLEEFYDFEADPDGLHNLIDDEKQKADIDRLRAALEAWMKQTEDPALAVFRDRYSAEARARFMEEQTLRAKNANYGAKKKANQNTKENQNKRKAKAAKP